MTSEWFNIVNKVLFPWEIYGELFAESLCFSVVFLSILQVFICQVSSKVEAMKNRLKDSPNNYNKQIISWIEFAKRSNMTICPILSRPLLKPIHFDFFFFVGWTWNVQFECYLMLANSAFRLTVNMPLEKSENLLLTSYEKKSKPQESA